ncbi:MAG: PepSY domain-containing protein, partial [Bacteroidota bacterium]
NKKHIPEKQRAFNRKVAEIYLAICLSMYPMIALEFILIKCFPLAGMDFLYQSFFSGWLVLSLFFTFRKDNSFTTRYTLLLGAILGMLVPVFNGLLSGNWIWVSWKEGMDQILFIDLLWIVLSATSFIAVQKIKTKKQKPGEKKAKPKVKVASI